MLGRIGVLEGPGKTLRVEPERLCGLPLLRIWLPQHYTLGQLRRGGKRLSKRGVSRVLTPRDFAHWAVLNTLGLGPVEPGEFCRHIASDLALASLEVPPGQATVILEGERVTASLYQTALTLCPQVRNLGISVSHGGETLRQELLREYGVPALESGQTVGPQLKISFSTGGEKREKNLDLSGPCPDMTPYEIGADIPLPEGVDSLGFLSALWASGRLGNTKIFVKRAYRT